MNGPERLRIWRISAAAGWALLAVGLAYPRAVWSAQPERTGPPNFPYVELEGTAEQFRFIRQWRGYYWRDDFTLVVRDGDGRTHRVISREPTPWTDRRLGTTYTSLEVDWDKRPRVQVIGVRAVDRTPPEFYDLRFDPKATVTAFIVRVKPTEDSPWRDYYINNWFHRWGPETDVKVLAHYANDDPHYTIYGYLDGCAAPFDAESQKLVDQHAGDWTGIIYHARLVKAENEHGVARKILHLMGRNKKTLEYAIFHGDPAEIPRLDQRKPPSRDAGSGSTGSRSDS